MRWRDRLRLASSEVSAAEVDRYMRVHDLPTLDEVGPELRAEALRWALSDEGQHEIAERMAIMDESFYG